MGGRDQTVKGNTAVWKAHCRWSRSQIDQLLIVEARRDVVALQVNHLRIRAGPFANLLSQNEG